MTKTSPVSLLPLHHCTEAPAAVGDPSEVEQFFRGHFGRRFGVLTISGRAAIAAILENLRLQRSDEVCIVTTFDYPNVSSCVTSTVFNYCKPSRLISNSTRAVIVIHEFGVPHPDTESLVLECRRREIPLIEDCAHTIDSISGANRVGTHGDWVVCSLPKIFPVHSGGVLLGRPLNTQRTLREAEKIRTVARNVSAYLGDLAASSASRRQVYRTLTRHAGRLGLRPVFQVTDNITPWFFPLRVDDVHAMAEAARFFNVEHCLWHGTNIVVFPCHQYLTDCRIEQIAAAIERGLER